MTTTRGYDTLVAVRELLTDKSRWTTKALARTRGRHECAPTSASAYKFCLVGAIWHVAAKRGTARWISEEILEDVTERMYDANLVTLNDQHGHAAVLAALDVAIAETKP